MAAPAQLTHLAFANGIDESQELELLDPMGAFPVLRNGRQDQRGGYTTRLGFDDETGTARFDGTTRTAGARCFTHGRKPCVIDGSRLDVFDSGKTLWTNAGKVNECEVTTRPLAARAFADVYGAALCNGYIATATRESPFSTAVDQIHVAVETIDGVVVRPQELVHTGGSGVDNAYICTYGVYFILIATRGGSANITAYYLNTTSAATIATGWTSIGNVATDKTTTGSGGYLFAAQSLTDRVAFAYVNNSGGASQVTVKSITIAGVADSANVNTSSQTPYSVGLQGASADRLWVAWEENGGVVKACGLTPGNLAVALSTTSTVLIISSGNTDFSCPVIVSTTTGAGFIVTNTTNGLLFAAQFETVAGAVSVVGSQKFIYGTWIMSRGFYLGGRVYAHFNHGYGVNEQGLAILCDFTDIVQGTRFIRPVASQFAGQVWGATGQGTHSEPIVLSATRVGLTLSVKKSESTQYSAFLVEHDFAAADRWQTAEVNGCVYMSGGLLTVFDGESVTEAGFVHSPAQPQLTNGGGIGPTGDYRYVATFEVIDGAGNIVSSGVSTPSSPITVANDAITVVVPPLAISQRLRSQQDTRVLVQFWRSSNTGAAPYHLAGSRENDLTTSAGVSFTDSQADAIVESNRLLYGTGNLPGTNGAGQDRRGAPYASDVVTYGDMLVMASGSTLWWSSQVIDGQSLWFNPLFTVAVPGRGDIVALEVVDGTLYVFKEGAIYSVAGEPPSDSGSSGGLGPPRLLASDVGARSRRGVVGTGFGAFFLSDRGIELLDRSGSIRWVGEQVRQTLASYPSVTSAVLDERNSLVRFSLTDGEEGRDLVYDLTLQTWVSVDDKTGSSPAEASADACQVYVAGTWRYAWLGADGVLWTEQISSYLDGSTFVEREAQTAWFKLGGLQGTQFLNKLLVLERYTTDHDLEVSLAYNYETGWRSARTYTRAEIAALLSAGWPITQLRHDAHDDAECQSMRVRLVQKAPTGGTVGSGRGSSWLGLTLDLVPKQGAFDVPEGAV